MLFRSALIPRDVNEIVEFVKRLEPTLPGLI